MTHDRWSRVDRYIDAELVGQDAVLDDVLQASVAAGLPAISVSPSQGKLLFILAKAIGARPILQLGTLGGYSSIWLARALGRGGRLVTWRPTRTMLPSPAATSSAHGPHRRAVIGAPLVHTKADAERSRRERQIRSRSPYSRSMSGRAICRSAPPRLSSRTTTACVKNLPRLAETDVPELSRLLKLSTVWGTEAERLNDRARRA
jgi:hypothetical protein